MKRHFAFGMVLLFAFAFIVGITAQTNALDAPVKPIDQVYGYGCCYAPATAGCSAGWGWYHKYYGGYWNCHVSYPPPEIDDLVGDCPIVFRVCW